MTAHWGIPDPAAATGSPAEIALAFKDAYRMLHRRIEVFAALPIGSLDRLSLQARSMIYAARFDHECAARLSHRQRCGGAPEKCLPQ
jgi:hypothetical protein